MKKLILTMLVVITTMACKTDSKNKVETSDAKEVRQTGNKKTTYVLISDKSTLTWKGFKPTGTHNGTISFLDGKINMNGGELAEGKFRINMNSIVNTDMLADNENNTKLIKHLKSPDFFDVEEYPRALFEITKVVKKGIKINVSGNLTVKGITKNITIPATLKAANDFIIFKSEPFKIDRTEFGIQYKSTKLVNVIKEKSIDDLFEMSFDILAKK